MVSILVLDVDAGTHHGKHKRSHGMERGTIKEGTHYKLVGIRDVCVVEMVQIGGHAIFRVLHE